MQHTPGPWHNDGIGDYEIIAPCGETENGYSRSQLVAIATHMRELNPGEGPEERSGEEVAANARLIAAAPSMLEALNEALAYIEDGMDDSDPPVQHGIIRAAIEEATGTGVSP